MASGKRPEHRGPPEIFYGIDEAKKYTANTRMIEIQEELCERALELLALPDDVPCYLLDIGCGSGLSGDTLTRLDHQWVGVDISDSMLDVALDREVEGDVLLGDMGQGMPFRPGSFDGAVSISALQWLCNADKACHKPTKRLLKFFSTLYSCLTRSARAVFQFYPENSEQIDLITTQALKAGFSGGVVVDYPNSTKRKKIFLCLFAGQQPKVMPKGLSDHPNTNSVSYNSARDRFRKKHGGSVKNRTDWIMQKKERRRRQGKDTKSDSSYTGRKRRPKF